MRKKIIFRSVFAALFLASGLIFLTSCAKDAVTTQPTQENSDGKIMIVTSFYPLTEFSKHVGGANVEVTNLVPPGAEPHDYEPTPQDIIKINQANIFMYNGAGFEPWVNAVKSNLTNRNQTVLEMGQNFDLLTAPKQNEQEESVRDPHIWLDPINVEKQVQIIRDTLITVDPQHAEEYEQNADTYLKKLAALDQKITEELNGCKNRDIVTSHASFGYFAKRYDFNQIAISGLSPEEEPSAKKLAEISDRAKLKKTQYIYYETLVSPKIAETLANEIGAQTAVLNPIEGLSDEEIKAGKDYISIMEENLKTLHMGQSCE